jgi:outer membrane protein
MKRLFLAVVVMMFSATVAAAGKVVVFNMQAAILQTDLAKKRISALEANPEYAALKVKFESLRADLEGLQKDAATNSMVWTDQQKAGRKGEGSLGSSGESRGYQSGIGQWRCLLGRSRCRYYG